MTMGKMKPSRAITNDGKLAHFAVLENPGVAAEFSDFLQMSLD
jgi:hypothetical protein